MAINLKKRIYFVITLLLIFTNATFISTCRGLEWNAETISQDVDADGYQEAGVEQRSLEYKLCNRSYTIGSGESERQYP